jgi:hypothetical protein
MNKVNLKYGLIALVGIGFSANVSATDLTCSDITFSPEAFDAYEFIDKACIEMVDREGSTYAKLTAKVVVQTGLNTKFRFRHADSKLGPTHATNAKQTFITELANEAVEMGDVTVGQDIRIYISDKYWSLPPVEVAEAAAPPPPPPPPPPAPEPEPEPEPEVLPTTASSLPLLALFGSLFLLLGGALRLSRKQ